MLVCCLQQLSRRNCVLHTCAGSRKQGGAARGQATTLQEVARAAALGVALQAVLGAPFLAAAPGAYVGRAFELSRAFLHTWSVNLKFLPERVFLSPALAAGLLAAHLALLWLFAEYRRARACAQQPLPAPSAQRGRAGRGHGGRSLGGCLPPAHHCPRNGPPLCCGEAASCGSASRSPGPGRCMGAEPGAAPDRPAAGERSQRASGAPPVQRSRPARSRGQALRARQVVPS